MNTRSNIVVVLEGLPGAGKTSLVQDLAVSGWATVPEITSQEIIDIVRDPEYRFLENDRQKIQQARGEDGIVVVDRGYISTLAYNFVLAQRGKPNIYTQAVSRVEEWVASGLGADYYLVIGVSPELSIERKNRPNNPDDPWTNESDLAVTQEFYVNNLGKVDPGAKIVHINGGVPYEEVRAAVMKYLSEIKQEYGLE